MWQKIQLIVIKITSLGYNGVSKAISTLLFLHTLYNARDQKSAMNTQETP
ncbi:hypothetical protein [Symbiopectobacterium sp. RP]